MFLQRLLVKFSPQHQNKVFSGSTPASATNPCSLNESTVNLYFKIPKMRFSESFDELSNIL